MFLADGSYVMDDRCGLTYGPITSTGGNVQGRRLGHGTSVVGSTLTVTTTEETLVYHRKPAGPPHQGYLPYLPPH